jgi:hypothetical protein
LKRELVEYNNPENKQIRSTSNSICKISKAKLRQIQNEQKVKKFQVVGQGVMLVDFGMALWN